MRKKSQLPLINQDAKFSEALIEMTKKCLGCTGIIDDNKKLIGIIMNDKSITKMVILEDI